MYVLLVFFPPYLNCKHSRAGFFYITEAFFKKNACRKAEKVREERDDDLNKLLQFLGSVRRTMSTSTRMWMQIQKLGW